MNWHILSLWQPFATLCVAADPDRNGGPSKAIETRHFRPWLPLPIKVAIHATKKMDPEVRAVIAREPFASTLRRCGFYPGDPRPFLRGLGDTTHYAGFRAQVHAVPHTLDLLSLGAIIGVAEIHSVVPTELLSTVPAAERAFGNYAPGRFGWFLAKAHRLPAPIPFSGRQSILYEPSIEIQRAIDEQLLGMGVAA